MHALPWIVLLAWLISFAGTILNLVLIARLRRASALSAGPLLSIIVPARNEERSIEQTVRALLAQRYAPLEVIVINDRSTDQTGRILEDLRRELDRLRVVNGIEPPPGWLGKPWALYQGSQLAAGELLLFVDADIHYAPEAAGAAMAVAAESQASLITIIPRFQMQGFWEQVAMPQLVMTAFTYLPLWLSNRTRIPWLGVGGGTGNLVRRSDYIACGGHAALRDAVVDDVALARLMRHHGLTTEAVRGDDLVSVRMYRGRQEIVEGFTKNIFAVFGRSYLWTIVFAILGVLFHVMPYGWAAMGSLAGLITVLLITLTRLILFASLRYNLLFAVLAHPLMVLFWSWLSLRSMWRTGVRGELAWRGRSYDASSTRFGADR